ncbi:MAG TPA: carbohydrate porin [Gemmatirosa sp.]
MPRHFRPRATVRAAVRAAVRATTRATTCVTVAGILLGTAGAAARAQTAQPPDTAAGAHPPAGSARWTPYLLGTQVNLITQHLARVPSPYAGPNSFGPASSTKTSDAYGIYAGLAASPRFTAYLDAEMIRGSGVNRAVGLAGYTNGDVIRQGTVDLGAGPYVARAFVRYTLPLGGRARDTLPRGQDQVPAVVASRRLEVTAGKLAVSDLFDLNRYANTTRLQFMNWGLFQNTAWDFAADTRGYTNGVSVAWVRPGTVLRVGSFQMPRRANGNVFDADLGRARGDQAELTVTPTALGLGTQTPTVRLLGYVNHARMGLYREAIADAARTGDRPDVVATDAPGRRKRGWGVNAELPLLDGGETGVFVRAGGSDGDVESFAFTEVEQHLSGGLQVSGARWHRGDDRLGVGVVRHGLSADHRAYLAAGGAGFLLGDGALRYGPESIAEAYYRVQLGAYLQVSPDVQRIADPGYNRDRGPATVTGVRVNLRY